MENANQMDENSIDINFSFTEDTANYWKGYWNDEMGRATVDPDAYSKTLKRYHKLLWSKKLPNGEYLDLIESNAKDYLLWNGFRFGSDSITASFRYNKYRYMIKNFMSTCPDYKEFMEQYTKLTYTIGGSIIFPKRKGGINQSRGCNAYIRDRFDLTLECIRLYYNKKENPLNELLKKEKDFFELFVDFRGYIDFFYLQDLVSEDYSSVKFFIGDGEFNVNPLPKTVEEYSVWLNKQMEFVKKRNTRIENR